MKLEKIEPKQIGLKDRRGSRKHTLILDLFYIHKECSKIVGKR